MGRSTESKKATFEVLFDGTISSDPAASIRANMTQSQLLSGQSAEICYLEITSPMTAAGGVGEALEQIVPVIDGKKYLGGSETIIRADLDANVAAPRSTLTGESVVGGTFGRRQQVVFGKGMPEINADANPSDILNNTTIKVKPRGTINFEYLIGNSAITEPFTVKAYGWKYYNEDILEENMARVYGRARPIVLGDRMANRTFAVTYPAKRAIAKEISHLIGGEDQEQDETHINKFFRWARNGVATTTNTDFDLSFDSNNVDTEDQNMDWSVESDELRILQGLGVRAGANHLTTKVEANGEDMLSINTRQALADPDGTRGDNELFFGRGLNSAVGANVGIQEHAFLSVPRIFPIAGHNETLKVQYLDNGTAIADGTNFGAGSLTVVDGLNIKSSQL
jgi:hypothetical protein